MRGALASAVSLSAILVLSSCQDMFNSIFDTAAPTGVSASDGDYSDRVEVHWGAPNLSGDKWKGYSVDHYDVGWSGPDSGSSGRITSTSFSIPVSAGDRAVYFEVTVETTLRKLGGSTESGGEASDKGFAMDAENLIWADGGQAYTIAGADRWYVTMLQKGFVYSFEFQGSSTGYAEFYDYKTLDPQREKTATASAPAWVCDEGGAWNKYYVHVVPSGSGAIFTARYGF
ncbi:MAG: hypothetical protein Q8M76_18860 [Spirochaetaceae bacterium]|nr:hypothetical protein [Spirochaetaceae bacterium]